MELISEAPALAMSVGQFCEAVGVCKRTYYNLVDRGEAPPVVRVGRRVLIRPEAARAWLADREQLAA